jgi:hypothetical protein
MHSERLGDDRADGQARTEGTDRILKNHRELLSHGAQRSRIQSGDLTPVKSD